MIDVELLILMRIEQILSSQHDASLNNAHKIGRGIPGRIRHISLVIEWVIWNSEHNLNCLDAQGIK